MEECAEMYVQASVFSVFLNPPDRTVLLAVGVTCVLGFSTSCIALPGFSNHQDVNPSGFQSRTLLSTTDYAAIKVSNSFVLSGPLKEDKICFLCDF